ncbi:MAG: hypothetical protein ACD_42C00322G0007 [uncultured bacterium]|nr:MAG: hypothetical protein ACD_42C00322G0007 [uncultured bacterium]OGT32697.1 MAG: hypothetical protein A3C44_00260 [Gammaproteobacteria bacterium RIFCSPHIGHO2_02_FULL_39_13]OGT48662.1 MAG: hypothetical protein A3E53_05230 [Gammaproteobacteria bacterium RIFCSPHIGHO2_12_FULL_39_24]
MNSIDQQVRQARIHQNLSQVSLAKLARVTQAMVSKVEAGRDVQLSTLLALVNVLGLEIVALTQQQSVFLRRHFSDAATKQSLLEQFRVKDDD